MSSAHLINLAIHITAGTIALVIGFSILGRSKGTSNHRYWGRIFCYFTLIVCVSAAIGTLFFRFIPVFAILSVLVPYQLISGWRSIYTKDQGPAKIDAILTLFATVLLIALIPAVLAHAEGSVVVYSSLGALATILLYDTIRWLFPRRWYRSLWKYEHTYKLIASIFAMLSALVGNVVRFGQPWSQILPSVVGIIVIAYYFIRLHQKDSRLLVGARA
ncbi:hypothetical protein [Solilutibacter silvestris]|uniref:DUF2306 domain-containing protein n=1 Tax=Solilutibacter silvestris TaxID=1645665 RepID=A0A2K1Q3X7_9GAMM|nr:hypothetical protein [Lysobacter silvestris]PNS09745.1 hypothetical protein Lysil_1374 [Lysobacter silvestris]